MTLRLLYAFQQASPFVPFLLHLADGRVLPVTRAGFLMPGDDSERVVMFIPPGITEFVDPALVVSARIMDAAG